MQLNAEHQASSAIIIHENDDIVLSDSDLVNREDNPIHLEKEPPSQSCDPFVQELNSVVREGESVVQSSDPIVHGDNPVFSGGDPVKQGPDSIHLEGDSVIHSQSLPAQEHMNTAVQPDVQEVIATTEEPMDTSDTQQRQVGTPGQAEQQDAETISIVSITVVGVSDRSGVGETVQSPAAIVASCDKELSMPVVAASASAVAGDVEFLTPSGIKDSGDAKKKRTKRKVPLDADLQGSEKRRSSRVCDAAVLCKCRSISLVSTCIVASAIQCSCVIKIMQVRQAAPKADGDEEVVDFAEIFRSYLPAELLLVVLKVFFNL